MVDYSFVTSTICEAVGNPFIVNMEDGYVSWINTDSKCSIVFCNWDICGNDISTQCELRIDSIPTNDTLERTILNGLYEDGLYDAVDQFINIAIEQYGF